MIPLFRIPRRSLTLIIWSILASIVLLAQQKTITILHTNDMHASFIPHEAFWVRENPKALIGGFNELSFAVDSIRQVKTATLLLDAGDVMTGNPITEYLYDGAEGGALFEMMNRIGYEVWTPGNHDFDISSANLLKLTEIAKFPTISANILDTTDRFPVNNKEYVVIEKNGLKIGIVGVMSGDFYNQVNMNSSAGIKILPPIETVKRLVEQLRPQTDVLIALTHEGVNDDSVLAMNVKDLDVIVSGHAHTRLKHPKVVNDVLIVQTGSNCENLGILDLTIENRRVVKYHGELLSLWYNSARMKTPLSLFIDSIKSKIDTDYAEVIGTLKTDWIRNDHGESGIGDFLADAQREAADADVAFMNNHGIRKDMHAGPLTKLDLFEILPFRNMLTTFELTGKQIRTIMEYSINGYQEDTIVPQSKHTNKTYTIQSTSRAERIQTSGLQCEWKRKADGEIEFTTFLVNGKPLDENKVYTGAMSDYMMGKAKNYLGIEASKVTFLNQTVFSVVEKKIRTMKEISSLIEHRIRQVQ